MAELQSYIQTYFGVTRPHDVEGIMSLFREDRLAQGEYLATQGRQCGKMSFVRSGIVRMYADTDDGEVTQWISTSGYFATDLSSFLFGGPSRWSIHALATSDLYTITREDYARMAGAVPAWAEIEKLFLAKCFSMLEDRVFRHLSMTAEQRYNHLFEHQRELFSQVPLQYLASMLGMSPETFSRIRRRQLP